jgi:exosortase B
MSVGVPTSPAAPLMPTPTSAAPWVLVLIGAALMYGPVYWWALGGIWQTEDQGHGPIILVVLVWLFWQIRLPLNKLPAFSDGLLGWPVFLLGAMMYVLGRVLTVSVFEFASQVFVAAGVILLLRGRVGLRLAWFPVLYLIFMIPLPGILVDAITGPLKNWISLIVVEVLYKAGYPIARNGVTITIGQYQMLVADACSGLHSMYSLSALGLLFMHVMERKGRLHNALMLASILPIAFLANIVRVIVLVLVTYHLGDEAGQGFLHGAAGMVLMMVSLATFFSLDFFLHRFLTGRQKAAAGDAAPP